MVITTNELQITLVVTAKQIQFLLDTGATYSVLLAFTGKPSSRTTIIIEVEGES